MTADVEQLRAISQGPRFDGDSLTPPQPRQQHQLRDLAPRCGQPANDLLHLLERERVGAWPRRRDPLYTKDREETTA